MRAILLLHFASVVMSYISPFHHWHCIDFKKNIHSPYAFNVGDLPLITWFDEDEPKTMLNICKHMRTKMNTSKVHNGSLVCPLHGIHHGANDTFGTTVLFEDKLWWSYKPIKCKPSSTPFYHHANYETITMKIDMNANIKECIFETFAFNNNSPISYKFRKFNDNKLGVQYTYQSDSDVFKIFQIFEFPYRSLSAVVLNNQEKIIINVNMLPLSPNETRWIVTLKHNFWKSYIGKMKLEFIIKYILTQCKKHMAEQANDSMLYKKILKNKGHEKELRRIFKNYHYPDMIEVMKLLMLTVF
jgi:hypothetical protein